MNYIQVGTKLNINGQAAEVVGKSAILLDGKEMYIVRVFDRTLLLDEARINALNAK